MKVIQEISLRDFNFWSGGADRATNCSPEELDSIEEFLEEIAPEEGWTDTGINDMFWFDFDTLAQHLGYKNEEDFDRQHDPKYINDDDLKEHIVNFFRSFVKDASYGGKRDWIFSLADLVGFDYSQYCDDEPDDTSDEVQYQAAYNHLLSLDDEEQLYEDLFEDNQGEFELDGEFPNWEKFREIKMDEKPENPQ